MPRFPSLFIRRKRDDLVKQLPRGEIKRGQPVLRGGVVPRQPGLEQLQLALRDLPAVPLKRPQRAIIDRTDLDAGLLWQAGEWRAIATFRVPNGTIYKIPAGEPYRLYVKAVARSNGYDNSGGATAYNLVINTPGIVQTKMKAPTLPSDRHPEVVAYADKGAGLVQVPVQAIDYTNETVTLAVPPGENWSAVEVYYVHGDGEFRIRAYRELGNTDTAATLLVHGSFGAIHTVSQVDREEAPVWPVDTTLVETNLLALEVRTGVEILWNARAGHMFQVEARVLQVDVKDRARLLRLTEIQMRGGL